MFWLIVAGWLTMSASAYHNYDPHLEVEWDTHLVPMYEPGQAERVLRIETPAPTQAEPSHGWGYWTTDLR